MRAMGYAFLVPPRSRRSTEGELDRLRASRGDRLHLSSTGQVSLDLVVITDQVVQSRYGTAGEHHALELTRVPDSTHASPEGCRRQRQIFLRVSHFYYRAPRATNIVRGP